MAPSFLIQKKQMLLERTTKKAAASYGLFLSPVVYCYLPKDILVEDVTMFLRKREVVLFLIILVIRFLKTNV